MVSRSLLAALAVLLGLAACGDKPVAPYPTSPPPEAVDTALGPGDLFEVRVFGEKDLTNDYQVAADGTIDFPLIGIVQVEGKQAKEIADEIEARLADGYLVNPQVDVFVKEYRSKRISVFGQVKNPGTFPYSENMSIVEAISRAGGFTALAKKNAVRLTRRVDGKTKRIFVAVEDIGQGKAPNFFLRPGDVVFVDERPF